MVTLEELQAAEKQLASTLGEVRKYTRGKGARGGGANAKTIEQHLLDGTYRADRHGPLPAPKIAGEKPSGIVHDTAAAQRRWIHGPADDMAVIHGCRFNEALAEYAAAFFPAYLCHSKGQWAGDPFELTDWQRESIIYPMFGWVRPDGTRRFRRSYIETSKKTGKSTLASGIGLYMLARDAEPGAEIWSLGADKEQARIVHTEAVNMVEASPELAALTKVNHTTFNILIPSTRSFYRAVSSAPRGKHGANLHCAIVDELHEWYGTELWESLRYAFRARRQPLLFVITNAGDDLQSVCYRQREKALGIISGAVIDDEFFALVCHAEREEAEAEIEAVKNGATILPIARRCNPTLGAIVPESALVSDIRDAIQTPSEIPNLLRLTYGIWNSGVDAWLPMIEWGTCSADFTEDDLSGAECYAGLDWSKTRDMTALVLLFPDPNEPEIIRQLAYFWLPEATIADRQHLVDYRSWVKSGHLRIGGEKVNETERIEAEIRDILGRFTCVQLAFDPMYLDETRLGDSFPNTEAIKFPQTIMQFAGPTAEYERRILNGTLLHNRNPVLTWQAGHCTVKVDLNNNKRPVKPQHGDIRTIDGLVGGIMGLRLILGDTFESAYESDDAVYCVDDLLRGVEAETDEAQSEEIYAHGELDE
jgi:phage terminase large subunit-like protein